MKKLQLFILMIFVSISACKTTQKTTQKARTNLETAIPDMIKLLEAEEYTLFFNTYVNPEDLEHMTKEKSLDNLIKSFVGNGKAEKLLKVLKIAQKSKPEYNETETEAIYRKEITGIERDLVLAKINGFWYIAN